MAIPMQYLPLSSMLPLGVALVYVVYLAATTYDDAITGPAKSVEDYIPIVYVISTSIIMYYIFLFNQSYTAFVEFGIARKAYRDKKTEDKPDMASIKYGSDNINMLAANRLAGNFAEQLPPFLLSLYLYATFVSVSGATKLGWAWLFFRSYYSWAYKRFPLLFASTIPAYCCVWYMIGGTIYEVSMG